MSWSPLSIRMGSVFGIRGSLEAEFHFWLQMNEKIPIIGQSRTTPGREVKVFSTMRAFTFAYETREIVIISSRRACSTHFRGVSASEIYRDCAP
jgi:hypothetical protein